ncbi:MAG: hypothetical protein U1D30_21640 [Planctomycetota bacterium]
METGRVHGIGVRVGSASPLAGMANGLSEGFKIGSDPLGGLATIEAIYAAYAILGRDTADCSTSIIEAREFLERNLPAT